MPPRSSWATWRPPGGGHSFEGVLILAIGNGQTPGPAAAGFLDDLIQSVNHDCVLYGMVRATGGGCCHKDKQKK